MRRFSLLSCACLLLATACGTGDAARNDTDVDTDTSLDTSGDTQLDTVDATDAEVDTGDDPDAELDGDVCVDGEQMQLDCNSCNCSGGQWECTAAECAECEVSNEGHAECEAQYEYGYYCNEGFCTQVDFCEAADCCVPGVDGDQFCLDSYGVGSSCDQGRCTRAQPPEVCGGIAGVDCGGEAYCEHMDNQCGGADGQGLCLNRPGGCDDFYAPVCGCDGEVYGNQCEANTQGVDVSTFGGCQDVPQGMFECGHRFCSDESYCQVSVSDVGGFPNDYACIPLPSVCIRGSLPACDCLVEEPCGEICELDEGTGGMTITCPGG